MISAMKHSRVAAIILLVVLTSACHQEGRPIAETGIRQVDAEGNRLPFNTTHANRWSRANDGTPYEPCTALTGAELSSLGIDPRSAKDAAGTNGQTARGCDWDYYGSASAGHWKLSQIVGNSPSLDNDKRVRSGGRNHWLDEHTVGGRIVGLHYISPNISCDSYVQSQTAAVTTLVMYIGIEEQPVSALCDRAIAFTKATIDRMPE